MIVTTETLHLDDLLFNNPSMLTEWSDMNRQSTWKEILMDDERMDFKREIYYLYDDSLQNEEKNNRPDSTITPYITSAPRQNAPKQQNAPKSATASYFNVYLWQPVQVTATPTVLARAMFLCVIGYQTK